MGLTQIAIKTLVSNRNVQAVRKILPTGTSIQYVRNGNNFQKIVNSASDTKTITNLTQTGEVTGCQILNRRGSISYSFGSQDYDKVVQVNPKIGGDFTLLGHRGRKDGMLYSDMSGRYQADGKYMKEFQQAIDYINGKNAQYLYSYSKLNSRIK